jgi:hypothetical protein
MKCHNCGMGEGAVAGKGRNIQITLKPENNFQRQRKVSVWVCSDNCAYQALAISKYGPATSKWPVTLAQFRSLTRLEVQ